jgi:four helix bundle protein
MHKYEDLKVYQKSLVFTTIVRTTTKDFPKDELYSLTSQFKRAADSIVLNITEGAGNYSDKEFARFLTYTVRSGFECKGCTEIAFVNKYIDEKTKQNLLDSVNEIIAMLDGLYKSLNK